IFASELDADKMDYLLRDSLFAGVKYGNFDLERILNVINLFPKGNSWHIGIDHDGVEAVEGLILARYFMFVQVYIHRTRRIYDAIMVQLVAELLRKEYGVERLPLDLTEFLKWDDCAILERAKYLDSPWSNMILNRRHFGCVYETELAPTKEERVLQRKVDNALKEELQNKYTPQEVIVDLFSKPAIKFLLPDEETPTINIISKADPTRTASFKEKAPVVAKLEEPIYAFRVYAKRNIATKVNKHIKLRREVIWGKLTEEQKGGFNHESEVAGGCSCEKEKTN
ncbi:MAG TPA: hypothetical protein VFD15_03310, partial [Clostridia bacterium]|nr:hypothetical protein [Clostridia bacterium]